MGQIKNLMLFNTSPELSLADTLKDVIENQKNIRTMRKKALLELGKDHEDFEELSLALVQRELEEDLIFKTMEMIISNNDKIQIQKEDNDLFTSLEKISKMER